MGSLLVQEGSQNVTLVLGLHSHLCVRKHNEQSVNICTRLCTRLRKIPGWVGRSARSQRRISLRSLVLSATSPTAPPRARIHSLLLPQSLQSPFVALKLFFGRLAERQDSRAGIFAKQFIEV